MAFNINEVYTMLIALEQNYAPNTLFLDTFFPNTQTFPTESVLVDYRKGTRRISPFVTRGGKGVNVDRNGFTTKEYIPPMMAPKRPLTSDDLKGRSFGENMFSAKTPEQRAMEIRAKDLNDLRDMNIRRREWMAAQLMLFGEFTINGYADDGKNVVVDTVTIPDWTQKLTNSGTNVWTDASSDVYGQVQDMQKAISRNSGRNPDVAIGSYATMEKFIKNASIQDILMIPNKENLALMSIKPIIVSPGVTRIGYIQALNLELYAYDGIYEDDSNVIQQYIPDGYFIMGVSGRGSQLFGAITQLEQDGVFRTYEGKDVPKIWSEPGADSQTLRLASRSIIKPEFVDDWYTLKAY